MQNELTWEQVVVARLVAGDGAALSEVYDQFAGYVFGLAFRVTRNRSLAEDVTQEVFCRFWQQPDRFDPDRGSLRTFLGTLTHRRSVDCVRSIDASRRRESTHNDGFLATPNYDIAEAVGALLAAEEVRTAVAQLPDAQRRPIELAYFEGYTFRQLAESLGIPEGTAKSRIRLGLGKLSTLLTDRELAI